MVEKLILTNFRKFKDIHFEFKKISPYCMDRMLKVRAHIEAIYLLILSIPWASTDEYINLDQHSNTYTRVESIEDEKSYSYFKDANRRYLKIDNKNVKPSTFFNKRSANIFNPEKIELLMISSSERRNFLDNTILKYNYEYQTLLKDFRKILRQRNAYLKKLSKLFYEKGIIAINDPQLNFWSNHFSLTSAHILQNRIQLTKALSKNEYDIQYRTNIHFDGRKIRDVEYLKECIEESLERVREEILLRIYKHRSS